MPRPGHFGHSQNCEGKSDDDEDRCTCGSFRINRAIDRAFELGRRPPISPCRFCTRGMQSVHETPQNPSGLMPCVDCGGSGKFDPRIKLVHKWFVEGPALCRDHASGGCITDGDARALLWMIDNMEAEQ